MKHVTAGSRIIANFAAQKGDVVNVFNSLTQICVSLVGDNVEITTCCLRGEFRNVLVDARVRHTKPIFRGITVNIVLMKI